jgi:hypothetical protein
MIEFKPKNNRDLMDACVEAYNMVKETRNAVHFNWNGIRVLMFEEDE